MSITAGTPVRDERDEQRYPAKGTWAQFRGRTGTVVGINLDRDRPHLTEYAVCFGKVWRGATRLDWEAKQVAWFKRYEITAPLASKSHADSVSGTTEGSSTGARKLVAV